MGFIDIHAHPTLKPFARNHGQGNSNNINDKNSIWYYSKPNIAKEVFENASAVPLYNQASFSACVEGNMSVIGAAMYPPEVGFFVDKLGKGWLSRNTASLITGIPTQEIKIFQTDGYNYFDYLKGEHAFLLELNNKEVTIENGEIYKYRVVKNYEELETAQKESNTLVVFVTIEGGHSYGNRVITKEHPVDETYEKVVLENILSVKNWEYSPIYQTFCHHFYNGLCGHTRSFPPGPAADLLNQEYGINTGITELGHKAIDLMLDESKGSRIIIDTKHFSVKGRIEYYELLNTKYKNEEIPIIFSHSAVNGRPSLYDHEKLGEDSSEFNDWAINLFDDEIVIIAKSKGMIGLELDRRVASSIEDLKESKHSKHKDKDMAWSGLVWNSIQHVAEVLDKEGLEAWSTVVLGTDYDGIINSLVGFWTEEDLIKLSKNLKQHAQDYLTSSECNLSKINRINPEQIIDQIFSKNAQLFLKRFFKSEVALSL